MCPCTKKCCPLGFGSKCSGGIDFKDIPVTDLYGSNCFSNTVMREKLPKNIYKEIVAVQEGEKELTLEVAELVAAAMREWAIAKGASHYTHLFQPLTGLTAEKHNSFISPTGDGKAIMEFSGKELIKGESDASSFPSGGLRATFEARGYTAWDLTSPAFLKSGPRGSTLCIPTAFVSYYGQALDEKVPLLKSVAALSKQAIRILRILGNTSSKRVNVLLGIEQEYFLIKKEFFDRRPDLLLTGRTVSGALPAKGQEMEDHYYGAIEERVAAFMQELNTELWKVGIPAKTQHNEVAPNQFEIVPIYCNSTAAVDANQYIMESIRNVARRHGMEGLLHEKPFAGVSGSGKHNNWSMETNDGIRLIEPGANPESNARFLLFTTAVVEAVDRYALLLRSSAATAGNDHRLGAHEAPPAIVSIFFGEPLTEIFDNIAEGKEGKSSAKEKIKIGVTSLPSLPKDISDRNRTSPFTLTGNKFEFRMVGSSQSVANSTTYLNLAVAQVLKEFADKLEAIPQESSTSAANETVLGHVHAIIKESYLKHRRVVFNGNGYTGEWIREAERRGLPVTKNAPENLTVLTQSEIISLFETHGIFTKEEMESRYQIYLEKYSKQINIEAGVAIDMARRQIFPAVSSYAATLARDAAALTAINAQSTPQNDRAKTLAELCNSLYEETGLLEKVLAETQSLEDSFAQAYSYSEKVRPAMDALRSRVDALEKLVSKEAWPFPGYEELLFKL